MTKNQIDYQRAMEDKRHNLESESITRFKEEEKAKRDLAESRRREFATLQSIFTNLTSMKKDYTQGLKNIADIFGGGGQLMG